VTEQVTIAVATPWQLHSAQFCSQWTASRPTKINVHIGGYARASYASGGGGASRMPQIAGDATTADSALVSCVLVSYASCAERRRF
jgi:hypothetical protein